MISVARHADFTRNSPTILPSRFTASCRRTGSSRPCARKPTAFAKRSFPPGLIVWTFIGQALDPDHSCRKALSRIQAHLALLGQPAVSSNTGGYCRARSRLPEGLFARLCRRVGEALSRRAAPEHLWHGRPVKVVDGTTCSMPDTPANQQAYPQSPNQAEGCGFPLVSLVGVFCLVTGAALDVALGVWYRHDLTLFYGLRHVLSRGDVLLADRAFCSYAELALLKLRDIDSVMRLHPQRRTDFRRGRVLGVRDHLVTWTKPAQCPKGLRKADYRRLPASLEMREVRYRVETPGFRTREITMATTLTDAEAYPTDELAALYFRRWEVEIDFRHIKETMQMDVLRSQSPEMVRKEIWTHLLAYNLVRTLIWESAARGGADPGRISFKGTLQYAASCAALMAVTNAGRSLRLYEVLLDLVAAQLVPHRPGRVEPRVRKRRPKAYPLMTQLRAQLKAAIGA